MTPSHLMDRELFDFANLRPTGVPDADGDKAFDPVDPRPAASSCGDDAPAGAIAEQAVRFVRPGGN